MALTTTAASTTASDPVDVVLERLNDPAVAASLVTLLDHAELLSTVVAGLSGFIERGDTIIESVADGVREVRVANDGAGGTPSAHEVSALASTLIRRTPAITALLESSMLSPETVAVLAIVGDAMADGAARARQDGTRVSGLRSTFKALRDPEVARGLGLMAEIAKALGRRIDEPASPRATSPPRQPLSPTS
jgi:hypothetical protein